MSRNGFYGIVMRPCSLTEEDNERKMMSTDYSVMQDFRQHYSDHIAAMQIVAECAKIYVTKNWERVVDWSGLNVVIKVDKDGYVEFFNYKKKWKPQRRKKEPVRADGKVRVKKAESIPILNKFLKEMDDMDKAKHNPVTSFSDVILDPSDGDFHVTINGNHHYLWHDEEIVVIADYIESQLKPS